MSDCNVRQDISAKERELMTQIRDSGVVNFDQLGKLVSKVTPELFNPGVVADDYIASGYSSVIKIWKTGMPGTLDNIAALKSIATDLRK